MTVQSGSVVPGFIAIWPGMQGGCSVALISAAIWSSDGPKSASQIDIARPLAPNCSTNSWTRMLGSAKLVSAAVQECPITGHGQDAAPQEVSVPLVGFRQVTV